MRNANRLLSLTAIINLGEGKTNLNLVKMRQVCVAAYKLKYFQKFGHRYKVCIFMYMHV